MSAIYGYRNQMNDSSDDSESQALYDLTELLSEMIERGASDLHLTVGTPPQIRIDGRLVALDLPSLTPDETKELSYGVLTESQRTEFERRNELDLSFGIQGLSRFRANDYLHKPVGSPIWT